MTPDTYFFANDVACACVSHALEDSKVLSVEARHQPILGTFLTGGFPLLSLPDQAIQGSADVRLRRGSHTGLADLIRRSGLHAVVVRLRPSKLGSFEACNGLCAD